MQKTSVLIIGAGPTGLMLASLLKKQQIDICLIDQKDSPTKTSNALGVQARTLELWNTLGLADTALSRGLEIKQFNMYAGKKKLISAAFNTLKTAYPFILTLPQAETEKLLTEYLQQLDGHVLWQHKLIALETKQDTVLAEMETPDGRKKIEANWVVGCDGYHSRIRALIGAEYKGTDLPVHFLMTDAKISSSLAPNQMHFFLHPEGAVSIFPMKDKTRVIAENSHDPLFKDAKQPTVEMLQTILKRRCSIKINIDESLWLSGFWVHERIATRYQYGRVFLAGDAAHAHSPAGGQGMNTGMQDAFNLAWKLALVINQKASPKLLQTYNAERRPIAEGVLKRSDQLTRLVSLTQPLLIQLRNCLLPILAKRSLLIKNMVKNISEVDVHYPHPHHPLIGQRIVDFNPQYSFLFVIYKHSNETQTILECLNKHYSWIHVIHANEEHQSRFKENDEIDYCLIRPDQYIGFVGKTLDELKNYFAGNLYL